MSTWYAIGGGNWTDATLNGGSGLWNSANDGSGSWASGGYVSGDTFNLYGNTVTWDFSTDGSTFLNGTFNAIVLGGSQLNFTGGVQINSQAVLFDNLTLSIDGGNLNLTFDVIITFGPGVVQTGTIVCTDTSGETALYACIGASGVSADGISVSWVPAPSTVQSGVNYGPLGTVAQLTGVCNVPGAGDVRSGVATGATTGTCAVPSNINVLDGISVDNTVGNCTLPTTGQVQSGVTFGPSGSETGTYTGSGGGGASVIGSSIIKRAA